MLRSLEMTEMTHLPLRSGWKEKAIQTLTQSLSSPNLSNKPVHIAETETIHKSKIRRREDGDSKTMFLFVKFYHLFEILSTIFTHTSGVHHGTITVLSFLHPIVVQTQSIFLVYPNYFSIHTWFVIYLYSRNILDISTLSWQNSWSFGSIRYHFLDQISRFRFLS